MKQFNFWALPGLRYWALWMHSWDYDA